MSFNSRPHKEVDYLSIAFLTDMFPFNSRPHKEVDLFAESLLFNSEIFQFTTSQGGRHYIAYNNKPYEDLSIHDLTRRSTIYIVFCSRIWTLSIHDLTRRSTILYRVDRRRRSTFQFTTSQGGRLTLCDEFTAYIVLSIHDLTRRSTVLHLSLIHI